MNEKIGVKVGADFLNIRVAARKRKGADVLKESDTGLAPPHLWDVAADRQRMAEEQPLQVARCTKIIQDEKDQDKSKYVINVKQIAKFVVNLGERVSPTDIEEGMRVGYVCIFII